MEYSLLTIYEILGKFLSSWGQNFYGWNDDDNAYFRVLFDTRDNLDKKYPAQYLVRNQFSIIFRSFSRWTLRESFTIY